MLLIVKTGHKIAPVTKLSSSKCQCAEHQPSCSVELWETGVAGSPLPYPAKDSPGHMLDYT
jgi:hypothetical protein